MRSARPARPDRLAYSATSSAPGRQANGRTHLRPRLPSAAPHLVIRSAAANGYGRSLKFLLYYDRNLVERGGRKPLRALGAARDAAGHGPAPLWVAWMRGLFVQ